MGETDELKSVKGDVYKFDDGQSFFVKVMPVNMEKHEALYAAYQAVNVEPEPEKDKDGKDIFPPPTTLHEDLKELAVFIREVLKYSNPDVAPEVFENLDMDLIDVRAIGKLFNGVGLGN